MIKITIIIIKSFIEFHFILDYFCLVIMYKINLHKLIYFIVKKLNKKNGLNNINISLS